MKKIFPLLFIVFLLSCSSGEIQERRWLENYNESLLGFPPMDWLHFPFDFSYFSNKKIIVYPQEASKVHLMAGLILDTRVNDLFFKDYYNILVNQDFKKTSMLNDSIFIIGDTIEDFSSVRFTYPLPDFSDCYDEFGFSSNKLSGKEEVFIIEYKQGEFIDSEHLVKNLNTPDGWSHGMSRGIAIDSLRKRIVYWLVYW